MKNKFILIMSFFSLMFSLMILFKSIFISIKIPILSIFYFQFQISMILDWMSLSFFSTVLFISSMIMKFSTQYIPKKEHSLFSILLILFILSMSLLIFSNNIIFIMLGWDGLGLSSYILVIYYQNHNSLASGTITILSNRIGDITILMSIAILFSFPNWNFYMNQFFPKISIIFLMIASMSKSAQFPFSAWLPAAMSAPTPISALVHSSTLVTAGIFLMIRISNFFHPMSMIFLMLISSMTAIYASLSALWEQDLKKIIALSTLSQMAMMMFAISLNSLNSAFFHLISHALFKSMMFLCAGTLIHNFSYQDMRKMSSMFFSSPIIISMLSISNISLMGIPFMSGFFSKDIIIEKIISSKMLSLICLLMIFSISLTSMYSLRKMILSSKFFFNSKPDLNFHTNLMMENSIIMMSMFPIFLGLSISWINFPFQIMILPLNFKISILISLILGISPIFIFSYKSNMYKKFGSSAISLWFSHFISSSMSNYSFNLSNKFNSNDKSWKESYGPQYMFNLLKFYSKYPDFMNFSSLSLLILISIIPIMLL